MGQIHWGCVYIILKECLRFLLVCLSWLNCFTSLQRINGADGASRRRRDGSDGEISSLSDGRCVPLTLENDAKRSCLHYTSCVLQVFEAVNPVRLCH